jgi:ribosomal protein S13
MNEHAHRLSMSERADELEEEKMHEMERIITKSTIAHLMDGEVKMDIGPEMKAK